MSLHKWFKIIDPRTTESVHQKFTKEIPGYFYLKWKVNETPTCTFLENKPLQYTFIKKIKWRNFREIVLYGDIEGSNSKPVLKLRRQHFTAFRNVPLLKSHLQKCIRRGEVDKAVMTAYYLLEKDEGQFLRRLPIIVVEDVCLIAQFPILIWLMVAYPNYQLYNNQKRWLLGLIVQLTKYPHQELMVQDEISRLVEEKVLESLLPQFLKLDKNQQTMALSLLLRKSYGGLKGDGYLLQHFFQLHVSQTLRHLPTLQFNPVYIIKLLLSDEMEICGADFHCFPQILGKLHQQYPDYTDDILKEVIWSCSSSLNFRTPHVPSEKDLCIWGEIQQSFEKLAFQLILRRC